MASRREVLQLGVSASVAAIAPFNTLGATLSQVASPVLFDVIHDTRFESSLALSRDLLARLPQTRATEAVDGDVAPLWYSRLSRTPGREAPSLAGVTGDRVLFCLQQFAREKHLRLQWQQAHDSFIADPDTGYREQLVSWLLY